VGRSKEGCKEVSTPRHGLNLWRKEIQAPDSMMMRSNMRQEQPLVPPQFLQT
jgi:hypothetical protein